MYAGDEICWRRNGINEVTEVLLRLQRLEKDIEDIATKCHKCLTMMEPDQQFWFYL